MAQVPLYTNIFVEEKGDPTKTTIILSSGFYFEDKLGSQWIDHLVLATESLLDPQGNFEKVVFGINRFDLSQFFSTLTIPTLHIFGEKDIFIDLEHSLYFASHSTTASYKDVGHCPLWENTKELNKDIMEFFEKV
ncbi:10678_t:CDS:2 [Funneliformis caledonium]|uniref:10678_t:CDS:1 n=1 Tax=Funneliformis caledonium TaxID=1117310 RepID=A0A9N9CUK6_9GLOM|nr:10678_t:CDS:2 [Funneliformis caledonium]